MRRAGSGLSAGGVQHPGCTLAQQRSPVPPRQPPPRTVPGSPGWTLEPPAAGVDSPAPGHGPFICPNKPPAAAGGAHEAVTPQSGGARGCPPLWHRHTSLGAQQPHLPPQHPSSGTSAPATPPTHTGGCGGPHASAAQGFCQSSHQHLPLCCINHKVPVQRGGGARGHQTHPSRHLQLGAGGSHSCSLAAAPARGLSRGGFAGDGTQGCWCRGANLGAERRVSGWLITPWARRTGRPGTLVEAQHCLGPQAG